MTAADGLSFLYQVEIGNGNYINIPDEVYEFFRDHSRQQVITYHWNYDQQIDALLLSVHEAREKRSNWLGATKNQDNNRAVVPEKARKKLGVESEENLYLLTHELMHQAEVPSVLVWDFDRIEDEILENNGRVLSRFPEF